MKLAVEIILPGVHAKEAVKKSKSCAGEDMLQQQPVR